MGLFSQWIFNDTIEINATPEAIWDFFYFLEKNYKAWHPEEHIKFKWLIEPKGTHTIFCANSYLRAGDLFYKFGKKEMDWKIKAIKKHTKEEGENLKMILEAK